jgi:hypothetical protein
MDVTSLLNYLPQFSIESLITLLIPIILTTGIIYFWMKFFHEPPQISHALFVATIANFQNFFIPFLIYFFPIPYAFQIIPVIFWILLIRIFYPDLDLKHVVIIGLLSFTTHTIFETYGVSNWIKNILTAFIYSNI